MYVYIMLVLEDSNSVEICECYDSILASLDFSASILELFCPFDTSYYVYL